MLTKEATFSLIDIEPLNNPLSKDGIIRNQNLKVKADAVSRIQKMASSKEADISVDSDNTHFDLEAEIKSHPDSLFVKCFAIKADEPNDNGDYFGYTELKKATSTFVGVPVFTNHQNTDIEEARGKVIHSWWDEDKNGIMIIARVDSVAYPDLARGIKEEYVVGTSMGASRGHDLVTLASQSKIRVDELQINDLVVTHTGKIEPVKAICKTQEHSKLYHMRWSGNIEGLALSYEHPVLLLKRENIYKQTKTGNQYRKSIPLIQQTVEPVFIPASEVKSGDYVLEWIDKTEEQDDRINEETAFILGVYAAEGYCREDKTNRPSFVEFCFGIDDIHIEKTVKFIQNNFKANIDKIERKERNGFYIRAYSENLIDFCKKYVGSGSKIKRLDSRIKRWPVNLQKVFVGAYLDQDGCLVKERISDSGHSSGAGAMQASSASLQLLKDIRTICLRLGCPATLSTHNRVASKSTVMDQSTEYIEHILYITNTISQVLRKFSHKASLSPEIKKPKFDSFFFGDYIAHRVKDVTLIDNNEPTYYVQVGEMDDENSDHSYILNDIATHNCQVKYSLCSICHNMAETPDQYCSHIRERKTRKFSAKNQKCEYHKFGSGECPICGSSKSDIKTFSVDNTVFEYNYGIKFIENSFVVNPACPDCGVTEIIDPSKFLAKVARIQKVLPGLIKEAQENPLTCTDNSCMRLIDGKAKTVLEEALQYVGEGAEKVIKAAGVDFLKYSIGTLMKNAGQKELDDLNNALNLITSVSQSMLTQKDQIDLEFLSDTIDVLADLQGVVDELTEQGYGRLQSPDGSTATPTTQTQQDVPTQPAQPTPTSDTSKVQTGPAGDVGTVTGPLASKKIMLEKISGLISRNKKIKFNKNINANKRLKPSVRISK